MTDQTRHIMRIIVVSGFLVLGMVDVVWYYWVLGKPWP